MGALTIYTKKDNRKGGFPSIPTFLDFVCFLMGRSWRALEERAKGLNDQGSSCPSGLSRSPGNGQLRCFSVIK